MDERSEEADAVVLQYAGDSRTFRLGPYGRRVEAAATSAVPILFWWVGVGCGVHMGFLDSLVGLRRPTLHAAVAMALHLLPFLLNALYAGTCSGTYGMTNRGLVYRRSDGGIAGSVRCFIRALMGVVCMALLPVSVITALWTNVAGPSRTCCAEPPSGGWWTLDCPGGAADRSHGWRPPKADRTRGCEHPRDGSAPAGA